MNKNIFYLIVALFSFYNASAQLIGQWSSTVTDAVSNQCSNGSIDLHPPSNGNSYTYVWTKTGTLFQSFSEDLTGLSPGQYNVSINGPLCDDLNLSYFVGLKEYNFEINHIQPSLCEPGRNAEFNGAVLITWNDDVLPSPTIIYRRTGEIVNNEDWIGNLAPGIHRFDFSVGDCEWTYQLELCCCSVSEDFPLPGTSSLCDNVNDEIPFSIQTNLVVGASGPSARDGKIRVLINSPGPDPTIKWRGPIPGNPIENFNGNILQDLLPGEYCYDYEDDCQIESGCIIVDDCEFQMSTTVRAIRGSCYTKTDGLIVFDLRTTENSQREFSIHNINRDGSTGSKFENLTIDRTQSTVLSRIRIENLAPGDYEFRVITSQMCEDEISFTIPAIIGNWDNFDNETCSRDVYCDGDFVAREFLVPEVIASEYCFINKLLCPMPGATVREFSTFSDENVSQIEHNEDEGTCSYLYFCEQDGVFTGVEGVIHYEELSNSCRGEIPSATYNKVCRFSYSEEITIDVNIITDNYETNGVFVREVNNCGESICIDPRLRPYIDKLFAFYDPRGFQLSTVECCDVCTKLNPTQLPTNSKTMNSCILNSNVESLQLVSMGSGHTATLSAPQISKMLGLLKNGNIINSSEFGHSLAPGVYILSSSQCKPLHVTIL